MKIIFLDIDGVLNSAMGKGPYISDMEVEKLILLKDLLDRSGVSGIVITSDRRYSKIDITNKKAAFEECGIKVLGLTRLPNENDLEDNRGKQIMNYLANSEEEIDKILILDDMDDGISSLFGEEFLLVNRVYGLDKNIYLKSLTCLNK